MRIGTSIFDDDGSTGGRFFSDEELSSHKAARKKAEKERAKKIAFEEAARKKSDDRKHVLQNLSVLTRIVHKMQDAGMGVIISPEDVNEKAYLRMNQYRGNYAVLHIRDKKFLMQLNHKDEVHIINQDMVQSSGHTPYTSLFENTDSYTVVHTDDTESLNKWAWGIFNTSIDRNCFSNLKPFLSYYK